MNMIVGLAVIAALLIAAMFAARSEWERRQIKTEYYSVSAKKGSDAGSNTKENLRLAFISDAHDFYRFPQSVEKCFEELKKADPSLVLLGGDMFTLVKESKKVPEVDKALSFIQSLAADYKVVYAFGNHEIRFLEYFPQECAQYMNALRACGVEILQDGEILFGDTAISGVNLDMEFYRKLLPLLGEKKEMPEKYLIGKLGIPNASKFNILLMHSPLYLQEAAKWGADLVLSGHFHGGTIRLPNGSGLMTPQYQFFNKFCSGIHYFQKKSSIERQQTQNPAGQQQTQDCAMIVNRGLGTHTFHIRINDLPEISIIDIVI